MAIPAAVTLNPKLETFEGKVPSAGHPKEASEKWDVERNGLASLQCSKELCHPKP